MRGISRTMNRSLRSSLLVLLLPLANGFVPAAPLRTPSAATRCDHTAIVMGRKGRPKFSNGMQAGPQQMQPQAPQAPTDGVPVFYLYCRTGPGKPWYPVSAMKGDGQSKGLIGAWLNSPIGKQVFKDRLDEGMARSIYDSERRLAGMAVEQYGKQLRAAQSQLQWGYKVLDADVMQAEKDGKIEKVKIVAVSKAMLENGGLLGQAQDIASGAFGKANEALKEKGVELPKMPKIDMPALPKAPWD